MSGDYKWATTKHKKAVVDARRGQLFAKLIKTIEVAARTGGGDPAGNPTLADAIVKAKRLSVPADNIDRAVKRGSGELGDAAAYEEITYEAYGPAGVAIMIESLTDNGNRTVADIRRWLSRNGGNLGSSGSVAWMFDRRGQISIDAAKHDEETVMMAALDAGALDVASGEDGYTVYTEVADFHAVQDALRAAGIEWEDAELAMIPKTEIRVEGADAEQLVKLLDLLEELDDVQKVYTNADLDADALAGV